MEYHVPLRGHTLLGRFYLLNRRIISNILMGRNGKCLDVHPLLKTWTTSCITAIIIKSGSPVANILPHGSVSKTISFKYHVTIVLGLISVKISPIACILKPM